MIIGFFDESSPQTTSNTQCLWSFGHLNLTKNTTKIRANTFGFYPINGTPVLEFHDHSKKEDVCNFLNFIRKNNPVKPIVIILDNFRSHHATVTQLCALQYNIKLIFLPPYSPDLNPIEFIWKSIKRVISRTFIRNIDHMKEIILTEFEKFASSLTFAKAWIHKFLEGVISINI